jgi:hypothetical protein
MIAALPDATTRGRRTRVVGLTQGYVGYVDTPERVREGHGEARRAWYGSDLMDAVTRGLMVAMVSSSGGAASRRAAAAGSGLSPSPGP